MLGSMLKKIRKDRKITKASVARNIDINIGHITHIEKGERSPSHKVLRNICKFINVPFPFMACLYDKNMTEEQERYKVLNHLAYDRVIAVNSIDGFVECSSNEIDASMALKVTDDSMEPTLKKDSYAFIELNAPLNNKDIGVFRFNNCTLIRRFIIRKDSLVLRADNKNFTDITLSENDNFTIIGKVCSK